MKSSDRLQDFCASAAATVDIYKSLFELALNASEQILSLNGDFHRSFIEGCAAPLTSPDFGTQLDMQSKRIEQTSEYLREFGNICTRVQSEFFKLGSSGTEELTKKLIDQMEQHFRAHPIGQSDYTEALQSVWSSARTTYEKFIDTSRGIAESSLAAATRADEAARKVA